MTPREEYQYDHTCLYVINPKGRLGILHTQFRAQVKYKNKKHKRNAWVFVQEVKTEAGERLLYKVDGELWYYGGFKLFIAL